MTSETPRILIIGAGLSGLSLGYRLRQSIPNASITLLEKRDRPGGNIWTNYHDGFRVETGPNGFLDTKPNTIQLCRDLGIASELIAGSEAARKNRYVFWKGKLRALPNSFWSFLTSPLLSLRGKYNLLWEKYRRRSSDIPEDESVAEFARRRVGKEVTQLFVDAMVTGIHAGDPEKLSMKSAFPRVTQFEREYGSVMRGMTQSSRQRHREAEARGEKYEPSRMWSFRQGLRFLIESLRDRLKDAIQTGVSITGIEKKADTGRWKLYGEGERSWEGDVVILTCPAYEQAQILKNLDPDLAQEMNAITYNRVVVVALGFRREDCPKNWNGFGYLAPQSLKRDVLGVQWCSSIYPDRAPQEMLLWRALCGGVQRPEMIDWDDQRLLQSVTREVRLLQGIVGEPIFHQIVRWPQAIPQYVVGHSIRVQRIENRVGSYPGLFVGGNAYHGVAMNDCTEQADRLSTMISTYLQDTSTFRSAS